VLRGDIESAVALCARSTSEFQHQPPKKQQQQNHPPGREPALHRAVATGDEDIVQLLLQHQANINSCDKNGRTALDLAIDIGHVAIVQILLAHGADIEGN
jgi:ankyrin repeat protein